MFNSPEKSSYEATNHPQADRFLPVGLPSFDEVSINHDAVIKAHYFGGTWNWWLLGYDEETNHALGFVSDGDPDFAEWGIFNMAKLMALEITVPIRFELSEQEFSTFLNINVEKDEYWNDTSVRDIPFIRERTFH